MKALMNRSWITTMALLCIWTPTLFAEDMQTGTDPVVTTETAIDASPLGYVTPWARFGDGYTEGLVDALIPLSYSAESGTLIFANVRSAFNDVSEEEFNLGLGIRQNLVGTNTILGANIFYDSRWTEPGSQFNQLGLGAEMLSTWIDARINGYFPENSKELTDTFEEEYLISSTTRTSIEGFATGNTIFERTNRVTTNTFQTDTFNVYDVPLEGFDAEIGFKLPSPADWLETRIFGGYYFFEPTWEGNIQSDNEIEGFKGRAEFRIHDNFVLDGEVFEDDRLFGSDYIVSAKLRLPFDITALSRGENPFAAKEVPDDDIFHRMSDMVIRDPHIQIRSQATVSSTTSSQTSSSTTNSVVLEDVIFVDGDNVADPEENGTFENPFDLINEGVATSAATENPNVFVDGADTNYTENVVVVEDINLYGAGAFFGNGTNPGDGRTPVWQSAGTEPFLLTLGGVENALVTGFTFDGSGGAPSLGGVLVADSGNVTITNNTFRRLPIGVGATNMGGGPAPVFDVKVTSNVFEDNILAVGGAFSDTGMFQVSNNQIRNNTLGVLGLSIDTMDTTDVLISNNSITSNEPLDVFDIQAVAEVVDNFFGPLPPDAELPLPMIGGITVAAINGNMNADILNNTVQGGLLGITALNLNLGGPDNNLNLNISGNTVVGGGLVDVLDLALTTVFPIPGASDFLDDLPFDPGLAGITALSIGEGALMNEAVISNNEVQDTFLGITLVAAGDGEAKNAAIENNELTDNLLGITGIGLLDGDLSELSISNNRVDGGGTAVLANVLEGLLGPIPFDVPDFTLGGITLAGINTDFMNDITIENNLVKDHVLGISALGFSDLSMNNLDISRNTLEDNFAGILVYGNGSDVRINNLTISANNVSGAGTAFLGNLLGSPIPVPEWGLAGISVVSVDGSVFNDAIVTENTVTDHLFAINAIGLDGNIRRMVITSNDLLENFHGVLILGWDADMRAPVVSQNRITGVGTGYISSLIGVPSFPDWGLGGVTLVGVDGANLSSFQVTNNTISDQLLGVSAVAVGADLRKGIVSGNEIEYGLLGVGAAVFDGGAANKLTVSGNLLTGTGANVAGGVPAGFIPLDLFTDKAAVGVGIFSVDGNSRDTTVIGNTIDNNEVGILVYEEPAGNTNNLDIDPNIFSNNEDDVIP